MDLVFTRLSECRLSLMVGVSSTIPVLGRMLFNRPKTTLTMGREEDGGKE